MCLCLLEIEENGYRRERIYRKEKYERKFVCISTYLKNINERIYVQNETSMLEKKRDEEAGDKAIL